VRRRRRPSEERVEEHPRTQVLTVDGIDIIVSAVMSRVADMVCYGVYVDDPNQRRRLPDVQLGVVFQHRGWHAQQAGVDSGPYDTIVDAVSALIDANETKDQEN
jgi:hypothetical protein